MRPKSSSCVLILRSSVALMVPSSIGTSYCFPVRLSVTVRVSLDSPTSAPFCCCVSVVMRYLSGKLSCGRAAPATHSSTKMCPAAHLNQAHLKPGSWSARGDRHRDRDHHQRE